MPTLPVPAGYKWNLLPCPYLELTVSIGDPVSPMVTLKIVATDGDNRTIYSHIISFETAEECWRYIEQYTHSRPKRSVFLNVEYKSGEHTS